MTPPNPNSKDRLTEVILTILRFLSLIATGFVIFIIVSAISDSYTTSENTCKNQCRAQNIAFESYDIGFLSNSVCNCKDSKGIIITVYVK